MSPGWWAWRILQWVSVRRLGGRSWNSRMFPLPSRLNSFYAQRERRKQTYCGDDDMVLLLEFTVYQLARPLLRRFFSRIRYSRGLGSLLAASPLPPDCLLLTIGRAMWSWILLSLPTCLDFCLNRHSSRIAYMIDPKRCISSIWKLSNEVNLLLSRSSKIWCSSPSKPMPPMAFYHMKSCQGLRRGNTTRRVRVGFGMD